jgi:hypothetical protein
MSDEFAGSGDRTRSTVRPRPSGDSGALPLDDAARRAAGVQELCMGRAAGPHPRCRRREARVKWRSTGRQVGPATTVLRLIGAVSAARPFVRQPRREVVDVARPTGGASSPAVRSGPRPGRCLACCRSSPSAGSARLVRRAASRRDRSGCMADVDPGDLRDRDRRGLRIRRVRRARERRHARRRPDGA